MGKGANWDLADPLGASGWINIDAINNAGCLNDDCRDFDPSSADFNLEQDTA